MPQKEMKQLSITIDLSMKGPIAFFATVVIIVTTSSAYLVGQGAGSFELFALIVLAVTCLCSLGVWKIVTLDLSKQVENTSKRIIEEMSKHAPLVVKPVENESNV